MPNPLIRLGRQNTGKKPQEHFAFGNTNQPDAPPEVEHYVGSNHPYRGTEIHGVDDTVDAKDVVVDYQATQEGITYIHEPEVETPIPVRIVQEYGRQFLRFRTHKMTFDGNTIIRILPRNEARTYAKIYNSGNQILAIGNNPSTRLYTGYTLNAANPFLEIRTQDEVWAWNDGAAGNFGEVQVYEEFAVQT